MLFSGVQRRSAVVVRAPTSAPATTSAAMLVLSLPRSDAMCKGVSPRSFRASGLAPASTSTRMMAVSPSRVAP